MFLLVNQKIHFLILQMEKRCIFWFINKKHFDSLPTGLIELVKTVDVVFCFESFKKDETYELGVC